MDLLLKNIDKIHTTLLGDKRIKKNLKLENNIDSVKFCKEIIQNKNANITLLGKNYYCLYKYKNIKIVINSYSYTIITAHII